MDFGLMHVLVVPVFCPQIPEYERTCILYRLPMFHAPLHSREEHRRAWELDCTDYCEIHIPSQTRNGCDLSLDNDMNARLTACTSKPHTWRQVHFIVYHHATATTAPRSRRHRQTTGISCSLRLSYRRLHRSSQRRRR